MIAAGCWQQLPSDKRLLVVTMKGQVGWRLVNKIIYLKNSFHKRFSMRFYILMIEIIVDFLGPFMYVSLKPSQAIKLYKFG